MTSSPTVSLGSVVRLNPRLGEQKYEDAELVDFVPMATLDASAPVTSAREVRPYGEVRKGYTSFSDGDILLAKITPCFENGKISQIRIGTEIGFGSTEFHVIRPNAEKLDPRYLVHFLRQNKVRVEGERRMTGSAGQRRVPKSFLEELPVRLPALSEQCRIAAILDKADALRAKRRVALELLEELAQSVFVEMLNQSKGQLTRMPIEECMSAIIDYRGKTPEKTDFGIPLVTARVVKGGELLEPSEFIAESDYDTWMTRGLPKESDVLFTTEAPLGEVAQLDGRKVALAQRLLLLRGNPKFLDNKFLMFVLTAPEVRKQILSRATGSTVKGIRQSELRKVILPIPPLAIQIKFNQQIATISRLRTRNRESLNGLERLFESLQNRAFQGEL